MNPDTLLGLDIGLLCPTCVLVGDALLHVQTTPYCAADRDTDTSIATVNNLGVGVGLLQISATTLQAETSASVTTAGQTTSNAGSMIQNLVINGIAYGNITAPTDIKVTLAGGTIADVKLLETITDTSNPAEASIAVNVIHVSVPILAVDLIVAHAESHAVDLP